MNENNQVRFGVIGTNWITEAFIRAASEIPEFKLTAVYSRTKKKGKEFAEKYNQVQVFTEVSEMAKSSDVDAVYIASPNSFHSDQGCLVMEQGKHVICEKPMASNVREMKKLIESAQKNNVVLMEGIKSTHQPNFQIIIDHLHKVGTVRRYFSSYCQYSSRYDSYKEGVILNAFDPAFSNGSLMDIGIYGIYPAIVLFGEPNQVSATGVMLTSGVDGQGSLLLKYNELECVIMHSKIANSFIPSEIQGEKGSMIINNIHDPKDILIRFNDGTEEQIQVPQEQLAMYYEAAEFIRLIKTGESESSINSHKSSLITAKVMEEARKQVGVRFPADHQS
ncbi:oxidoreductase [Salipaludibacillus neizhouensis]|uniref:Oxidoreductase n=1 Tax=Salipaludibacillus neizhouensis TaxID=885475 RepID=A0A3A9KAY1_9BACI|nr:Gfo/Idh/MocA family oxidoreductase [Salipaludibacillus neizhouensis]RKL67702.1 oxidoreductase [Salipaludibacillus neizhouensis]